MFLIGNLYFIKWQMYFIEIKSLSQDMDQDFPYDGEKME